MVKSAKRSGEPKEALEFELGGLFSTLGNAVDLLGKLAEAGVRHAEDPGDSALKGLGTTARGVYGFSIRRSFGGDGIAGVEPFGNVHATKEGIVVDEVREPMVDVFDEGGEVVITAELPGTGENEITIEQRDRVLLIASRGERHYAKEVVLPSAVEGDSLRKKYNNGVLEIRARKVSAQAANDQPARRRSRTPGDRGRSAQGTEGKR